MILSVKSVSIAQISYLSGTVQFALNVLIKRQFGTGNIVIIALLELIGISLLKNVFLVL